MSNEAFTPVLATATGNFGASQTIAVGASSLSANLAAGAEDVYLYWSGTGICQVRWGVGAQTAVTTDMTLAPGTTQTFGKGKADTIAAIAAGASAGTLYISSGNGP